jgi:hypothetical protein
MWSLLFLRTSLGEGTVSGENVTGQNVTISLGNNGECRAEQSLQSVDHIA